MKSKSHPSLLAGVAIPLALLFSVSAQSQTTGAAPGGGTVASTPYAIGAQRNGIQKCIGRINQITSFITGTNANSGMVLNSVGPEANQRIASTVLEIEGGGITSYASASFAPGAAANECSGTYEAVTYWPSNCSQVAAANFATFKASRPLYKNVMSLDGGQFAKVFLMPAGTGCVSIKKEMVF